jgi:hypothetical protein
MMIISDWPDISADPDWDAPFRCEHCEGVGCAGCWYRTWPIF